MAAFTTESNRSLEALRGALDSAQLHALGILTGTQVAAHSQALVAVLIIALECVVTWTPRAAEHCNEILKQVALAKRSVTFLLVKLVRVDIFSSCLASSDPKDMVDQQSKGVAECQGGDDNQSKGGSKVVNGFAKRNALAAAVYEDLSQAGANKE